MNIIGMSQTKRGRNPVAPDVPGDRPPGSQGRPRPPTASRAAAKGVTTAERRTLAPRDGARKVQGSPLRLPIVMLLIYLASLQVQAQADGDGAEPRPAFGDCEIFGQARPAIRQRQEV